MHDPLPFILLASRSPRRRELLQQIGVRFEVLAPADAAAAEALEAVLPDESPADYVQRITWLKLAAAREQLDGQLTLPVLCADTTVALGRQVLGKPASTQDAARMMRLLAGRAHEVLTAVAVAVGSWQALLLSRSVVTFGPLDEADIATYVQSGEWQDKAGGYAIQGRAAQFARHISGSYSGIMGLPLYETVQLLRQAAAQMATKPGGR